MGVLKDLVGVRAALWITSAKSPEPVQGGERRSWWRRISYP
jgi:hypothetical protein